MPRIVFLSDTHGYHRRVKLPEGDILIHAGDVGGRGNLGELEDFAAWYSGQPHVHKILVAGNHDFCFQDEPAAARRRCEGFYYLQDEGIELLGLKFYGSPWQPRFHDWAFNLDRGPALTAVWAKVPDELDVLITHSPPYGILDRTLRGTNVGCEEMLKRVEQVKPKLHLFGHIHEGYGEQIVGSTRFVNGSVCSVYYLPTQSPFLIEL